MEKVTQRRFSYADYEAAIRGPGYPRLRAISADTAGCFRGCDSVLDIASGQGFLLDALRELEIPAVGVDNEPQLVQVCRSRGLDVVEQDVLDFLKTSSERFDGAYCGHLIEHLPYEVMLDLIEGVQRVLRPGGTFIVRWPNPRSGHTVFYTYWKDPTHVRFYDGDFVKSILTFYGFDIVESHYDTPRPRLHKEDTETNGAIADAGTQKTAAPSADHAPSVPASAGGRKIGWQLGALLRRLLAEPLRINDLSRRVGHLEEQARSLGDQLGSQLGNHEGWIQALSDHTHHARLIFDLPDEAYIIARRGGD